MTRLIAMRMFNYPSGTRRRLQPGEEFDAGRDAKALVDVGLAKMIEGQSVIPRRVMVAQTSYGDEGSAGGGLTSLRQQYEHLAGRVPDLRWGTERLRREIEASRMAYQRRDMRAED